MLKRLFAPESGFSETPFSSADEPPRPRRLRFCGMFLKTSSFARRILLLILLPLLFTRAAWAQESWVIESFNSEIFIPKNGKVQVVETIEVDFSVAKHGIFRTIPTQGIKFRLGEVKQDGTRAITDVDTSSERVTVRIGDPDVTISGKHKYEIEYEVGKVITRFDDHDELYWDVTGTEWGVSIRKASATVALEGTVVQNVVCYTGRFGSQARDCSAVVIGGEGEFVTVGALSAREGLTVATAFPTGLVEEPFYLDDFLKPYWLILGSLAAVAYVVWQWWKHGRDMWYKAHVVDDPKAEEGIKPLFAKRTVVVEFEPPLGLRPGEVGTLVDERINISDISSTIVDLAVRGYLKIIEKGEGRKRKYRFEKLKEADESLKDWEREVLEGIFKGDKDRVELDALKNKFYRNLSGIREKLYAGLTDAGYFPQPPNKVMARHAVKAGVLLGATAVLFYIFSNMNLSWVPIPVAVLGVLMLLSSPLMPRKTGKGTEAVRRASGFKLFISTAQKYMQQFNERINRFDEFLPYAMAFGVTSKWVKTFEKLGVEPPKPSWYVGPGPFNAASFASSVHAMESSFASTLPSSPSQGGGSGFGGGGFSGGGFGGGGGGSW
ncbi:DUF2207 domain-containing protein [Candidatus Saccharibacteria bacterium]|nr:DUF2207 domain-containing protein [Candidatus Saccharibacteria bacterium]